MDLKIKMLNFIFFKLGDLSRRFYFILLALYRTDFWLSLNYYLSEIELGDEGEYSTNDHVVEKQET